MQGLFMLGDAEQGQCLARIHRVAAQRGGYVGIPCAPQEPEAGVATGGKDGRRLAGADLAAIFVPGHVAYPMQAVLDLPVAAPQRQQACRIGLLRRETGQGDGCFAGRLARPPPAAR